MVEKKGQEKESSPRSNFNNITILPIRAESKGSNSQNVIKAMVSRKRELLATNNKKVNNKLKLQIKK